MSSEVIRRSKTHPSQWGRILDFAEKNPIILTKKMEGPFGREKYEQQWTELTSALNSMGYVQKSKEKWQKAVADWKGKVRGKAASIKSELNKTGGGGPGAQLTEMEKRLIGVMGWTSIRGDGTLELGCSSTNTVPDTSEQIDNEHNYPFQGEPQKNSNFRLSPPPLMPLLPLETTANTLSEPLETSAPRPDYVKIIRKKIPQRKPSKLLRQGTLNLDTMHKETISILNEININIKKMGEAQEKLCEIHSQMLDVLSA